MRLSDAIALGRTLVPGLTAAAFVLDNGCRCARGAAALAVGSTDETGVLYWPWLYAMELPCPVCRTKHRACPAHVINHMMHKVMAGCMTLDQLIDWVRSVEPAETESEVTETQAVEVAR